MRPSYPIFLCVISVNHYPMKQFLLAVLVFFSGLAQAQYLKFSDDSNEWYVNHYPTFGINGTEAYVSQLDTIIGSERRSRFIRIDLNGQPQDTLAWLLEDTVAQTLSFDFPGGGPSDYTIDFTWQQGDTFSISSLVGGMQQLKVDTVYQAQYYSNGPLRKTLRISPADSTCTWTTEVVEGLGPMTSPIWAFEDCQIVREVNFVLRCKLEQGQRVYGAPGECYILAETEIEIPSLSLYPNPAQDYLHIEGLNKPRDYTLYNSQGALLLKGRLSPNAPLTISALARGVYTLSIRGVEERLSFYKQ